MVPVCTTCSGTTTSSLSGSGRTRRLLRRYATFRRKVRAFLIIRQIELIDTMIEDARRLFTRSPILFRMSTRQHIISSRNTRYGVDTGNLFQTFATSSAIKPVISMSSSYFNSLKQYREADQAKIRPRFLQTLVLLLSLINDGEFLSKYLCGGVKIVLTGFNLDDLRALAEFLQITYRITAERQHLELLDPQGPAAVINQLIHLLDGSRHRNQATSRTP
jgi:hypothetical protein